MQLFFARRESAKNAESAPEALLKSYVNPCHISAKTPKFKSAVLVSGLPFQAACENSEVPCLKWMSRKCAYRVGDTL